MDILSYIIEKALILIPVLNIIGMILKSLEKIPDRFIPLILLVLGIGGSLWLMGFSAESAIQGILVTGAAVFGNQLVKQLKKAE